MNIGIGELAVILVNLILILGALGVVLFFAIMIFRRLRNLEARLARLDGEGEATVEQPEQEP